jgi:hypothetical protein
VSGPAERYRDSLLAGGVFVVVGVAFAVAATRYELGTALRMGPGYLPAVLGALLAGLGLVVIGQGLAARVRSGAATDPASEAVSASADRGPALTSGAAQSVPQADPDPHHQPGAEAGSPAAEPVRGPVPWTRAGLLAAAVLVFGLTVRGAGLVPALFLTAFLAGLAGRGTGPVRAALIAVALTVVCVLVFVFGLQLRLPLLGTWFG